MRTSKNFLATSVSAVALICGLAGFLPLQAQEYDIDKIDEVRWVETSMDGKDWYVLCNNQGYCATGEDLRIAKSTYIHTFDDLDFLILILGDERARAIISIQYANYWRALNRDNEVIMQGKNSR